MSTDPLTPVTVTLPLSIATRVVEHAKALGIPKARAYRELLAAALDARPDRQIAGQTIIGGD